MVQLNTGTLSTASTLLESYSKLLKTCPMFVVVKLYKDLKG